MGCYIQTHAAIGLSREYWMDDELCKECYDCKSVFTTWRRKHHCRICGMYTRFYRPVSFSASSDVKFSLLWPGYTHALMTRRGAMGLRTCSNDHMCRAYYLHVSQDDKHALILPCYRSSFLLPMRFKYHQRCSLWPRGYGSRVQLVFRQVGQRRR